MERFEFDSKTGPNSNRKNGFTRRGVLEIIPDFITFYTARPPLLLMEIKGPQGADRGGVVIDQATAGKLGAALLKWAGADDDVIGVYSKKTGKIIPWAEL